MPPLVLLQTQRFLSSEKTACPAASSSPIWRHSMQTKAMAPARQAAPGYGRAGLDDGRDLVVRTILWIRRRLPRLLEHQIDLGKRETGDLHVEFKVDESLQFDREHLVVPAGIEGELVVGEEVGPAL